MAESKNFIEQIIDEELKEGGRVYGKKIHTRFPPEPNGYLHIGDKSIVYAGALIWDSVQSRCRIPKHNKSYLDTAASRCRASAAAARVGQKISRVLFCL